MGLQFVTKKFLHFSIAPASRVCQIFAAVSQLLGQFMEHVLEDDVVDVLTKEVQEEPITHPCLVHDNLHTIRLHSTISELEQVNAKRGGKAKSNPRKQL